MQIMSVTVTGNEKYLVNVSQGTPDKEGCNYHIGLVTKPTGANYDAKTAVVDENHELAARQYIMNEFGETVTNVEEVFLEVAPDALQVMTEHPNPPIC